MHCVRGPRRRDAICGRHDHRCRPRRARSRPRAGGGRRRPGDATVEATVPAGARARRHDHAEGARRDLRARRRRGGVPRGSTPTRVVERLGPEGEWREPPAPVLRVDRRGARAAYRRAHGAELPRPALGRRHADRRASCGRSTPPAARRGCSTRARRPRACARSRSAAVADGGGVNHRAGLYDFILIKENHAALAGGVGEAVRRARERAARPAARGRGARPRRDRRGARRRRAAAAARQHDARARCAAAVAQVGGRAELEASGGVTPETVVVYSTINGLDYVSMGALTHSAPALDLSLLLETSP